MLNYIETHEVLTRFYMDCVIFWRRENGVIMNAIKDVENLTCDPFSPSGKKLDEKAKADFLRVIKS